MLISDPNIRAERARAKREAVLAFLADEVWSSAPILGQISGVVTRQGVHRLLVAMEQAGEIRRANAPILAGQGVTLWGITPHGLALTPGSDPSGAYFQPSKLSIERVPHQLALQRLRLAAEASGWEHWIRGERMGKVMTVRPDALVTRPDGNIVAIECELTVKTTKRYQRILFEHLQAIRAGRWVGVYYVSTPQVAAGLTRLFTAIKLLPGAVAFDDARRTRFKIVTADAFPPRMSV